ncbi:hypothetical protein GC177_08240 [bacterium]|nr:hypothetical protein [bacterium]
MKLLRIDNFFKLYFWSIITGLLAYGLLYNESKIGCLYLSGRFPARGASVLLAPITWVIFTKTAKKHTPSITGELPFLFYLLIAIATFGWMACIALESQIIVAAYPETCRYYTRKIHSD